MLSNRIRVMAEGDGVFQSPMFRGLALLPTMEKFQGHWQKKTTTLKRPYTTK